MKSPVLVLAGLFLAVLLALSAIFMMPAPPMAASEGKQTAFVPLEKSNEPESRRTSGGREAVAKSSQPSTTSQTGFPETPPTGPNGVADPKETTLEKINEAMITYSAEGLPVLKPYLANPDPEIRAAAVEAIIQLAAPEGADVLRKAAKSAKTSQEQIEMLKGAEFLELPRLPVSELKKLMQSGAVKIPAQAPIQTPNAPPAN